MNEEQIRAKAQDYKKKMIYSGSAETDAENGFIAGAMFVQQLLQQTPCTTQVFCGTCDGLLINQEGRKYCTSCRKYL